MKLEEIRELINEKGADEPNYKSVEALIASVYNNFTVDSSVASFRIMYSYLIAFGYLDGDEAQEIFEDIVLNYSTYELAAFAKSLYSAEMVEYYEELMRVEHMTSLNPIVTQIDNSFEALQELLKDSEGSIKDLESLLKELED